MTEIPLSANEMCLQLRLDELMMPRLGLNLNSMSMSMSLQQLQQAEM